MQVLAFFIAEINQIFFFGITRYPQTADFRPQRPCVKAPLPGHVEIVRAFTDFYKGRSISSIINLTILFKVAGAGC
jgi:hypothetical protein